MRSCLTCQHLKRPEIDRRLAAGEPLARVAPDYALTTSSLYRHRTNCLKLASSNAIAKEAARGTAALALLPTKETLSGAYFELRDRIDHGLLDKGRGGRSRPTDGLRLRDAFAAPFRTAQSKFCSPFAAFANVGVEGDPGSGAAALRPLRQI
jgi:hypothetical protein